MASNGQRNPRSRISSLRGVGVLARLFLVVALSLSSTSVSGQEASCELNQFCNELTLTGSCCPTIDGWTLECCANPEQPVQPQCGDNPACAALGLTADSGCCPTVDNVFLDCCSSIPNECQEPGSCETAPSDASCELNQFCDELNLTGVCCPSSDGLQLACCNGPDLTVQPECSANPDCAALGLTGDCCVTVDGVYLDCCQNVPNECQEPGACESAPSEAFCQFNQFCDELGLTGLCCSTVDGVTLECCNGPNQPVQPKCGDNPECAALGLTADSDCCATVDNVYLDCCSSVPNECQEPGSCDIAPSEAFCELNDGCRELGLDGLCCPSSEGVQLACCSGEEQPVQPACADNPACAALDLTGNCCTTVDNIYLDCCEFVPNECQQPGSCDIAPSEAFCELNEGCNELGLDGFCCPTSEGVTLACCSGEEQPVKPACADNPACAALNLTGQCCATVDNVYLDCCEFVPNECLDPNDDTCILSSSEDYAATVNSQQPNQSLALSTNVLSALYLATVLAWIVTTL